jgi:hypothetical protein
MSRFYGDVGYGETVEVGAGVFEDTIVRRKHYGDVLRNARRSDFEGPKVNADITVSNTISIVADAYASEHFFAIRFVEWAGALWSVTEVVVERPRLLLRLGGPYNGPEN